ncbi:hypothetical protein QBC38DRAFT_449510 [Podospora fimiseda]|uniref:Uncharacterized protein n=1 Tax=Podospora fimiseda TaxID=252190 RepID=A0AAN6YQP8_9PEZI|nr:hypothetical protein QBC38DRAFT_449510 [Podospora fimiseda]
MTFWYRSMRHLRCGGGKAASAATVKGRGFNTTHTPIRVGINQYCLDQYRVNAIKLPIVYQYDIWVGFVGHGYIYIERGTEVGQGMWSKANLTLLDDTIFLLKPVINMMYECCGDPRKHHGAVFEKYVSPAGPISARRRAREPTVLTGPLLPLLNASKGILIESLEGLWICDMRKIA